MMLPGEDPLLGEQTMRGLPFTGGAPTRSGYHNREWAARMETLGLIPSDTGRPGGKRTGQSMGHYVSDGGPFEQAAKLLRGSGWEVPVIALLERPRPVSKLKCQGRSDLASTRGTRSTPDTSTQGDSVVPRDLPRVELHHVRPSRDPPTCIEGGHGRASWPGQGLGARLTWY